jgi:hypothetical protein
MAEDDLSLAYELSNWKRAVALSSAAAGAAPTSAETRTGDTVQPGAVVRDKVTGQLARIVHVTRETLARGPAGS